MGAWLFYGLIFSAILGGNPDRESREFIDATKRACAISRDVNPEHNLRECVLADMARRKAEAFNGGWQTTTRREGKWIIRR